MSQKSLVAIIPMLAFAGVFSAGPQSSAPAIPKTSATTPAGCLKEINDYAAKRQKEVTAATTNAAQRSASIAQISQAKLARAKECAGRLDVKKLADNDLRAMADLYNEAAQPELTKGIVARMLASKSPSLASGANRAAVLVSGIQSGLKEPKTAERNARLEKYVDELDLSSAATVEQKLEAHVLMNNWYRYDDVDSGIIKHSTWIIEAFKKLTPAQRQKSGNALVSAYINLAQALAGQGMNDEALALLARAKSDRAGDPKFARSVDPEIARLKMVGTPGAPIKATRWLNLPGGKTELPMPGSVTLLEFSAHWCIPCKESYPGVKRLLAKYQSRGFRVVLATQYYGTFEKEQGLTPQVEFERDRKYFADHGMNVPVAVADNDINDQNYKVGGIPQIHLVDKRGRIRLVMVGYDDANEPKLAKMIEDLLKES